MTRDIEAMIRAAAAPERVAPDQIPAAAADLSDAFRDEPLLTWISRIDAGRHDARREFMEFILRRVIFGPGAIYRPATGGAAIAWIPAEHLGPQPIGKEIAFLPVALRLTGLARLHRLVLARWAIGRHQPMERPHDYLFFLGVVPEAQGKGIGAALMRDFLRRLDARRRPAFLETAEETNLPFYARFGFKVTAEYRAAPNSPRIWAMWRQAGS